MHKLLFLKCPTAVTIVPFHGGKYLGFRLGIGLEFAVGLRGKGRGRTVLLYLGFVLGSEFIWSWLGVGQG